MSRRVSWSDLPPELLSIIAESITSPLDISRFRSVCKSWSSSVSRPPNLLSPMLPLKAPGFPNNVDPLYSRTITVISSTSVYLLHAPINESAAHLSWPPELPRFWLLFVDEVNPGKLYLRNPLSKSLACPLPTFFPESVSLLDFHPLEVGKYCSLSRFSCNTSVAKSLDFPFPKPHELSSYVDKLVLFSNGGVLILQDSKLILSKLGENGYENWVVIHDGKGFKIDDIVDYNGRVYAVNRRGRVYRIEYDSPELNVIGASISGGGGRRKRLIASHTGLYLIVRLAVSDVFNDAKFKVYILIEAQKKWIEVSSLDDQIFFVGLDYSFSVSVKPFAPSCQGNCIIFTQYSFPNYNGNDDDNSLFRQRSQNGIHGVFHLAEGGKFDFVVSCPIYSHMLWPPPFWLWANTKQCIGVTEATRQRSVINIAVRSALARFREKTRDLFNEGKLNKLSVQELDRELDGFQEFNDQIIYCCQQAVKENKTDLRVPGSLVSDVKHQVAKGTIFEPLIRLKAGKTAVEIKDGQKCNNSAQSSVKNIDWAECFFLIWEAMKECREGVKSIIGKKEQGSTSKSAGQN